MKTFDMEKPPKSDGAIAKSDVDLLVSLPREQNKKARLAILWTLLNISTDIDIPNKKVIVVMQAIEERLGGKENILNTVWKENIIVTNGKKVLYKRYEAN